MKVRESIINNYLEGYNSFNVDRMILDLGDEFVFENIANGVVTHTLNGVESFKEQAAQASAYFSERKQIPISFVHSPDRTEVEIDYYAILAMDFPTGEKAGEEMKLTGKSIFHFKDDKIIGITDVS